MSLLDGIVPIAHNMVGPDQPGILGIHCPHRGADLSYGRVEDGGLRCIYHGWLFDRTGRCLEQPGEPAGSTFHERIRHRAYPCVEVGGLILTYLGPGEPPLVPNDEFLWHVPIDDAHHWKYNITFRRTRPLDRAARAQGRTAAVAFAPIRNRANRYLQDREEMKTISFAGLGRDFQAQDACVTEGAGPIQDRTAEHLGYTDKGITAARKVLLQALRAVQAGQDPQHVIRDPARNHFPEIGARKDDVPATLGWYHYWEQAVPERERLVALRTGV